MKTAHKEKISYNDGGENIYSISISKQLYTMLANISKQHFTPLQCNTAVQLQSQLQLHITLHTSHWCSQRRAHLRDHTEASQFQN